MATALSPVFALRASQGTAIAVEVPSQISLAKPLLCRAFLSVSALRAGTSLALPLPGLLDAFADDHGQFGRETHGGAGKKSTRSEKR